MLANRVWVWVHRGTASDRRTGFVEMSRANAGNAIVAGRAQDPMVGELKLKHIDYTVPEPEPDPEAAPRPALMSRRRSSAAAASSSAEPTNQAK